MLILVKHFLAARPWTFPAAAVPILVAGAVIGAPLVSYTFGRVLCLGITVQAGANLTNTYYDFKNGVDRKHTLKAGAGESTLVDKKLEPGTVYVMSVVCYAIGFAAALPTIIAEGDQSRSAFVIVATGMLLSFFYSASPVGLKYKALGDITVCVCFGPLLSQCTAVMLTGSIDHSLWLFCFPTALLTEAIFHAKNARNIEADEAAGVTTMATLIGFEGSFLVFCFLILGTYTSLAYIALLRNWGVLAAFATLPRAASVCGKFHPNDMRTLSQEVTKVHSLFGILMLCGVLFTNRGMLK